MKIKIPNVPEIPQAVLDELAKIAFDIWDANSRAARNPEWGELPARSYEEQDEDQRHCYRCQILSWLVGVRVERQWYEGPTEGRADREAVFARARALGLTVAEPIADEDVNGVAYWEFVGLRQRWSSPDVSAPAPGSSVWIYRNPHSTSHEITELYRRAVAARMVNGDTMAEARWWLDKWLRKNGEPSETIGWRMLVAASQPDHAPTADA